MALARVILALACLISGGICTRVDLHERVIASSPPIDKGAATCLRLRQMRADA
jgi:hypothetical protein